MQGTGSPEAADARQLPRRAFVSATFLFQRRKKLHRSYAHKDAERVAPAAAQGLGIRISKQTIADIHTYMRTYIYIHIFTYIENDERMTQ